MLIKESKSKVSHQLFSNNLVLYFFVNSFKNKKNNISPEYCILLY